MDVAMLGFGVSLVSASAYDRPVGMLTALPAGTLFRFPLRTPAAAAQSDIRPRAPTSPTDALALLGGFRALLPQVCT